ncbi:MAG: SufE family protein [Kangiellaceae bacterium]|jgi:cysteine desulfuration protein SufE|nr:SufE family protein [Kangiellaceae bacterium]
MTNPFGHSISSTDIIEDLGFFDSWEDRYRYIIDLGKQLPTMDDSLRTEDKLVPGCQSQVWLNPKESAGKFQFDVDSDAHIVRGLLAIVMAAYNNKTAEEISRFDIDQFFSEVDLVKHLSPTRGNGLRAIVHKIKALAGAEQ